MKISVDSLELKDSTHSLARTDTNYVTNNLTISGAAVTITGNGGNQIGNTLTLSGGSLDMNGFNETVNYLKTSSSRTAGLLTNTSATTSVLTIQNGFNARDAGQYQGKIAGNVALNVTGGALNDDNSIIINKENTYSGGTTISGAIRVSHGSTLTNGVISSGSLGTGTITLDGGQLQNNENRAGGNLKPIDIANKVVLTSKGGSVAAGWGQNRSTFSKAYADGISTGKVGSNDYRCYLILSGAIADKTGEKGSFTILGDGGWITFSNSGNTYSGNTIINANNSRLAITGENALSPNSVLQFNAAGRIDLYGHSATAAGLYGENVDTLSIPEAARRNRR